MLIRNACSLVLCVATTVAGASDDDQLPHDVPTMLALTGRSDPPALDDYDDWCKWVAVQHFDTVMEAAEFARAQQPPVSVVAQDGKLVFFKMPLPWIYPVDTLMYAASIETHWKNINLAQNWEQTEVYHIDLSDSVHAPSSRSEHSHDKDYNDKHHLTVVNDDVWSSIGAKQSTRLIPFTRRPRVAVIDLGIFDHNEFRRPGNDGASIIRWYESNPDAELPECVGRRCCTAIREPVVGLSHGTEIAGLIAANDDGRGIAGLGEVAELMSIPVEPLNESGCFSRRRLVAAAECARQRSADIINISMQSYPVRQIPVDLVQALSPQSHESATEEERPRSSLVVVAAGNGRCGRQDDEACKVWPGALEDDWVVTVGAVNEHGMRSAGFNGIKNIDIDVPVPSFEKLCSTVPGHSVDPKTCSGGYARVGWTSAATALATGAATRIWGHPNFDHCTAEQIRRVMRGFGVPSKSDQSVCVLNVEFLYEVRRDQQSDVMNLCTCPELATDLNACGDLRSSLCGAKVGESAL